MVLTCHFHSERGWIPTLLRSETSEQLAIITLACSSRQNFIILCKIHLRHQIIFPTLSFKLLFILTYFLENALFQKVLRGLLFFPKKGQVAPVWSIQRSVNVQDDACKTVQWRHKYAHSLFLSKTIAQILTPQHSSLLIPSELTGRSKQALRTVSRLGCVIYMDKDKGSTRDLCFHMICLWLSSEGVMAAVFKGRC